MKAMRQADKLELQRLYEAFAQTENAAEVATLMDDLCTIREINEMAQRLTVATMLANGSSYTAVGEATGASATTIARVSKCLNHGTGGYRRVVMALCGGATGHDVANATDASDTVGTTDTTDR
jgi:TrpR-related protein YerC/YecD